MTEYFLDSNNQPMLDAAGNPLYRSDAVRVNAAAVRFRDPTRAPSGGTTVAPTQAVFIVETIGYR